MPLLLRALPQRLLIGLMHGYRLLLRPWLGNACRFEPSCSVYALQALERHGAARGSYLTLRRLARCHPFCEGGFDPVPEGTPPPACQHSLFASGPNAAAGTPSSTSTDKNSS